MWVALCTGCFLDDDKLRKKTKLKDRRLDLHSTDWWAEVIDG